MENNPLLPGTYQQFIADNIGLVRKVCNTFTYWLRTNSEHVDYDDLFQVGSMGLMYAYTKYSNTDNQFSSYAIPCIRGFILKSISRLNVGPTFSFETKRIATLLVKQKWTEKTPKEIAQLLEISPYMAQSALDCHNHSRCLAIDFRNDDENLPGITLKTNISYERDVIVNEFYNTLKPKQKVIVRMLCEGYNGEDVAKRLGITRSNVSAIFLKVLKQAKEYGEVLEDAS